jgi:hypothetical protein
VDQINRQRALCSMHDVRCRETSEAKMNIHIIDTALVARGRSAFRSCVRQYLGQEDADRERGFGMIPGAIVAAIEMGIVIPREIAKTVARVTRCRDTTVAEVLEALGAPWVEDRLWAYDEADERYYLVGDERGKLISIMTN